MAGHDAQPRAEASETTNPFSSAWNNTVAICAIMREENIADIREWLQYHRYIGVDRVFLHENGQNGAAVADKLQDFISDGFLSFRTVSGIAQQIPVYDRCLQNEGRSYAWLMAIDLDEFLVVTDPEASSGEPGARLKSVLNDFRFRPAVWVQWRTFGPSEHKRRPAPGGPMQHYTQCIVGDNDGVADGGSRSYTQSHSVNKYGKSIVNTFWGLRASNAHGFLYRDQVLPVDDTLEPVVPDFDPENDEIEKARMIMPWRFEQRSRRLVLYHYATRSWEDYQIKLARGGAARRWSKSIRDSHWFDAIKRSQTKHKQCELLVHEVDACCNRKGAPWPPQPPAAKHPLAVEAVPEYPTEWDMADHSRMPSGPRPMAEDWQPTVALCTLLVKGTSHDALVEWVLHHRHIGVDKLVLFHAKGSPARQLKQHRRQAAHDVLNEIDVVELEDSSQDAARERCVADYRATHAFIAYMESSDYIMVRGSNDTAGALPALLSGLQYRYNAGVVMPVFHFQHPARGTRWSRDDELTPLRAFQQCVYLESHMHTRTLGNSFWVSGLAPHHGFRYRADYLPVTDAGSQYVLAARDWEMDLETPLQWPDGAGLHVPPALRSLQVPDDFGARLAVFSFPVPGRSRGLSASHIRALGRPSLPACAEARAAAEVCCAR